MEQHTEPSTPLRLPLASRASATPSGPIHLPKTDMLDLLNRQKSPKSPKKLSRSAASASASAAASAAAPPPPHSHHDHKKSRSRPTTPHAINAFDRLPYVLPKRTPIRRSRLLNTGASFYYRNPGGLPPAVYDEHYIGPITIEYLRFFTRQLVATQDPKQPPPPLNALEVTKHTQPFNHHPSANDPSLQPHISGGTAAVDLLAFTPKPVDDARSIPSSASDFNYSLPLPKTDLQLPPQFKEVLDDEISPFVREVAPPGPVIFPKKDVSSGMSYLERILAAQKVAHSKPTNLESSSLSKGMAPIAPPLAQNQHDNIPIEHDSGLVPAITTAHDTPQTPEDPQWFDETLSKLSPVDLAQLDHDDQDVPIDTSLGRIEVEDLGRIDVADLQYNDFDTNSVNPDIYVKKETKAGPYIEPLENDDEEPQAIPTQKDQPGQDQDEQDQPEQDHEDDQSVGQGHFEDQNHEDQDQFDADFDLNEDFTLLPGSPIKAEDQGAIDVLQVESPENSIMEGQFTVDEGETTFLTELQLKQQINDRRESSDRLVERIKSEGNDDILNPAKRQKTGELLPMNVIKQLIKSIHGSNDPGSKKSMSVETMQFIQQASDVFLDSFVADLELYSNHRTSGKGSSINALDVLLYFKRTNLLPRGSATTEEDINGITRVAHRFLPLEQLVGLEKLLKRQKM